MGSTVSAITGSAEAIGEGLLSGYLGDQQVKAVIALGLQQFDLKNRRVLAIVPDGTRTMPMALVAETLESELAGRVKQLDYLIATGTHVPMTDEQLTRHFGRPVRNGCLARSRIFNHASDDENGLIELGVISADEIAELSGGRLREEVPVRLNRAILDYDFILVCGPVFPHEVAGFSGGTKYFFPGIAGREIIDFTHWLGALITNYNIIGIVDTPVRRVIDRAAAMAPRPGGLVALVTHHEGVGGVYCGSFQDAWHSAAELSSRRHVVYLPRPVKRLLAVVPEMYADLWTGGKGMYKSEPAVADGGEVVIYAPHIREVSRVHGRILEEIGYHCRDYFLAQWERFRGFPGGVLAHSTHVKGQGAYDAESHTETPRIQVTLATGISEAVCRRVNLGYMDPATVDIEKWREREADGWLVVPRSGEMLYRVGEPCTSH